MTEAHKHPDAPPPPDPETRLSIELGPSAWSRAIVFVLTLLFVVGIGVIAYINSGVPRP